MASVLAAQLYTLRQFTRTPHDIAQTLRKVKRIGYDAVQCSGLGPIEPAELGNILREEGLTCCATHIAFDKARDQAEQLAEEHRLIGCSYPAIGSMPGAYPRNEAGYAQFAREAGEVARKLITLGLVFGYHNHSFELERIGQRSALQFMFEQSHPALTFEVDTYWIQHGGGDPAAYIRQFAGRIPLIHLKDMVVAEDSSSPAPSRLSSESDADYAKRLDAARAKKPIMAEVGEGNLNWPAILSACRDAGVVWYIVEQDTCQRDPFESLAISLKNLREMGLT